MPRPKQYGSDAEKQAAYRARREHATATVDKGALNRLHTRLDRLQAVLRRSALTGDSLARSCCAASTDTMLDKLIALFEERGDLPRKEPDTQAKTPIRKAQKETGRVR